MLSLLWQVHAMEVHGVRRTYCLAWLFTIVVSLCTRLPMDHTSVTVFIHLSAHRKKLAFLCFVPGHLASAHFRSSVDRFLGPFFFTCSAWPGVARGHCFSVQTFLLKTYSQWFFSWCKQFNMSVLTAATRIRMLFVLPHTFNIPCICSLCLSCPFLLPGG